MTRLLYQPGNESREVYRTFMPACSLKIPVVRERPIDYSTRDICPVGDVPFCESVLKQQGIAIPKPDFYPTWLSHWMHRIFTIQDQTHMASDRAHGRWFVKSADECKAYPARIVGPGDRWPEDGRFIIAEIVQFTQEWRYYVADGQVVATGWYDGDDEDEVAPDLGIDWPAGFCGAVDFGRLSTGELALVECHHPYACGWYGDDHEAYLMWLLEGFEYMKREFSCE